MADLNSLLAELGGDKPQNRAIAEGLLKQGVTSTKDIGVEKVLIPRHMEGTDEAANWVEDSYTNKYVNKSTGEEINPTRLGIIQNGTGGVKGGDIFFHLNADDQGNVSFRPQWSPRAHGFLRDNAVGQAIMSIGSIIPATSPFFLAAKGADSLAHGNVLGGLAALTGAAGVADIGGLGSAFKNAATGLNVANAVDKGNLAGAVNALTSNSNLAGGLGSTPIAGTGFNLGDVGNAASLASNLASGNPNIGAALGSVGSLTGNQDLSTAGKAVSLGQGIMSGNPMSALNSMIGLGKLGGTGGGSITAPIDDRSIQAPQFDTSAFNSSFQQPVSPDLTATNTSGTINMDDEDIPSYDLSQYISGLNLESLGGFTPRGGVTLPNLDGTMPEGAFTSEDQQRLNELVVQRQAEQQPPPAASTESVLSPPVVTSLNTGWQGSANDVFADPTESGLESGYNREAELERERQRYLDSLEAGGGITTDTAFPYGVQDFGTIGANMPAGGFTSQWQTVGDNKVFVNEDGTAISTNTKTGATSSLSSDQVSNMIKNGQLNTYASGYNTATGGNKTAPGGSGIATTPAKAATTPAKTGTGAPSNQPQGAGGLGSLLPLLLMMYAASQNKGSGSGASSAGIPALTASQMQTPYATQMQAPTYRPGQGGITYFNPVQYTPKMAAGGIAGLSAAGGRLLDGAGDGVSDSIPATIGRDQPAKLARGEFVVDARTVAELGNGSTDAGADKLLKMMQRVHQSRKKAGRGQDSHADRHLPA